jgi:hypothetical protein
VESSLVSLDPGRRARWERGQGGHEAGGGGGGGTGGRAAVAEPKQGKEKMEEEDWFGGDEVGRRCQDVYLTEHRKIDFASASVILFTLRLFLLKSSNLSLGPVLGSILVTI